MMSESRKPLTYAESGVDIDTGNRIVDRIRPLARATRSPGASSELGGFGGLFYLRAAGFVDPILVAANDGVGTKLKIAAESGVYDTIGIDRVRWGSTTLSSRARSLSFSWTMSPPASSTRTSCRPSCKASPRGALSAAAR